MAPDFTFPSFPPEERQVLVDTVTKHGKLPDEEFQHELQKIREEAKAEAQKNGVEYQPYDPKFRQLLEQARQVMARRREEKELARQAEEAARATNEPEPMDVDMDDSPITSPREPREDTAVESIPRDERKVKRSAGRPRRKDSTTPTTAEYTPSPQADLSSHAVHLRQSQPPTWYLRLKKPGKDKQKREQKLMKDPRKRQIITALSALKDCLARCETERNPLALEKHFNDLRNYIHQAEFLAVDDAMLVKLHLLDADNGLTKIFAPQSNVDFPWDLKEDARQLYRRWADGKFEISLLRGILTSKTKDDNRSADRLDPRWDTVSPKYYGEGSLVLGQWWPTQLCTVRDGAHGSSQGGKSNESPSLRLRMDF